MCKRIDPGFFVIVLFSIFGLGCLTYLESVRLKNLSRDQVKQLAELRMEVNRLNDKAGFNAGLDPDLEHADLRRWSRRDAADNLYPPDDHAEFAGRRDTFDRRPSAGKGGQP